MVQRDSELDHPEPRAEMSAGHRNGVDSLLSQLGGKLRQVLVVKRAEVLSRADTIKQKRRTFGAHGLTWLKVWKNGGKINVLLHLYRRQVPVATTL
jgi:hypothetical protein